MRKRVAVKLLSGAAVAGVAATLLFVTMQSAGVPDGRQTAKSAPAVEWCTAGASGPQGPGCASLPRSIAQQDIASLPPVPTLEPQPPLMASSFMDEMHTYAAAVLDYTRDLQVQLQAATVAAAPEVSPPVTQPNPDAIRGAVEAQVETARAGVPQPPAPLDLPALPEQTSAHNLAAAIRAQAQAQLDRVQAVARIPLPASITQPPSTSAANTPDCTTEQTSGPHASSTAIRCFQQHVRTDGVSTSSVVTTSSSVSSSTTSSADVP